MFLLPCMYSEKGQNPAPKLLLHVHLTPAAWSSVSAVVGFAGPFSESVPPLSMECVVIRSEGHSIMPPCGATPQGQSILSSYGVALPPVLSTHISLFISKIVLSPNSMHFRYRNACYRPCPSSTLS